MAEEKETWVPKTLVSENEREIDGIKRRPVPAKGNESNRAIPLDHNTIRRYVKGGIQSIRLAAMLAGQDERLYLGSVKTGASADMALASVQRPATSASVARQVDSMFARGDEVLDKERGKRVTILRTNVAFTQKGTPIHKVVSAKTGDKWLVSEKKLRKL